MKQISHFNSLDFPYFIVRLTGIVFLLMVTGCRPENQIGHFYPQKESELQIEFDYSREWGLLEEEDFRGITGGRVKIYDPIKPVPSCILSYQETGYLDSHCFDNRPVIFLDVWNTEAYGKLEDEITSTLTMIEKSELHTLIEDQIITIDGIHARMITRSVAAVEVAPETIIYIDIYVKVNERGYWFSLWKLPPDEVGGNFHQAFLDIIASIKFVR